MPKVGVGVCQSLANGTVSFEVYNGLRLRALDRLSVYQATWCMLVPPADLCGIRWEFEKKTVTPTDKYAFGVDLDWQG